MKYSLLIFFVMIGSVIAEQAIFEKVDQKILASGDFQNGSWKTKWNWPKNNKAFTVSNRDMAIELQYNDVTGRGQISSDSFHVPAGQSIKISLWAKAENFDGGLWVNLEQPNEKPVAEQAEFFIAGGNSKWLKYEHRVKVSPKETAIGNPVKLKLWFYMYGRGKVLLKDVNVEIISKDEEAEKKWFTEQIKALSGTTPSINGNENIIDLHKKLIFSRSQKLSKAANWGILTTHSMAKVLRDKPFLHPFTQTIELDIARHEYEGVQVCIFTKNEDLKNVTLSIDGLKGPGVIDKAHVEILPVAYGNATKMPEAGFFSPQSSDWLPDALLSNRSFNVEKGTVQPVYIRFYVPRNTIPGKYTGSLYINSNSGKASVPVTLNVSSYTLPTRLTLKTMLLGGKGAGSEDKAYLDLALQNRMPPGKIFTGMSWTNPSFTRQGKTYDFTDVEKRLQYAIDRGLNSFALCTTAKSGKFGFPKEYSQEWKKKMSHIVREYSAFLEKKGWLDMAYYYNIDEPWNTRWNQVKEIYDMVKKVNPKIKVLSCVNKVGALEALKNHADVFDVYMQQYYRQQSTARKREGKEMWWAVCIWPDEKPNLFLTNPLSEARMIGWLSYKYQVDGFEYWDMNSWTQDWKRGLQQKPPQDESWMQNKHGYLISSWPYPHTRAGDGYLVYPGNNNTALNSLRFEALRDGLEEHEMMTAASKTGASKEVNEIMEKHIENVHIFNDSPAEMLKSRKVILQLLSK